MCKFCESKKRIQLSRYDNRESMNISYGQYQGVNVESFLSMQGNMLILDGWGSYRSKSDCYYEDWGVECENKNSRDSEPKILQIKFCPFCGRDLSNERQFEVEDAKRKLAQNKEEIKHLERLVKLHNVVYAYIKYDYKDIADKLHAEIFGTNPDYKDIKFISACHAKYDEEMKKHIASVCQNPLDSFDNISYYLVSNRRASNYIDLTSIVTRDKIELHSRCSVNTENVIISSYWRATDEEIEALIKNNKLYIDNGAVVARVKPVTMKDIQKGRDEYDKNAKRLEYLKKEQFKLKTIIKGK